MRSELILLGSWLLLITGIGLFSSCSSPSSQNQAGGTSDPDHTAATRYVNIAQMAFSPAELTVNKGDKVVFVNNDLVAHDVTEEGSKAWSSSTLQPGQEWTLTITASADYYCTIHPVMKGKIIVR